jgi:predicted aconitase
MRRERLSIAKGKMPDLVAIGCPHLSFIEFTEWSDSRRKKINTFTFEAFTSRTIYGWIRSCGILKDLAESGVIGIYRWCLCNTRTRTGTSLS